MDEGANNLNFIYKAIPIMIMDDIKMNQSMLQQRIMKAIAPNDIITTAEMGEQALEICRKQHFDVFFCDQYMEAAGGVLVGTDVIIAMRRNKVESFIIGCSGNDLTEMFFGAGANIVRGKRMPTNGEIIEQWRKGLKARNWIARIDGEDCTYETL